MVVDLSSFTDNNFIERKILPLDKVILVDAVCNPVRELLSHFQELVQVPGIDRLLLFLCPLPLDALQSSLRTPEG